MLLYGLTLFAFANPFAFGEYNLEGVVTGQKLLFIQTFTSSFLIPVLMLLVMKALGMVSSLELPDKSERIGPFVATGTCYIAYFYFLKQFELGPTMYRAFVLGATIALFAAMVINLFMKISLHATGMGGLVAMALLVGLDSYYDFKYLMLGVLILAGAVGTARLWLRAHTLEEVYSGYIVGFASQLAAYNLFFWYIKAN